MPHPWDIPHSRDTPRPSRHSRESMPPTLIGGGNPGGDEAGEAPVQAGASLPAPGTSDKKVGGDNP